MLLRTFAINYIFVMYIFFSGPQFEKNLFRKLKIIALPVYFMVLNFEFLITASNYQLYTFLNCLMPVTFYPSVVILRRGG